MAEANKGRIGTQLPVELHRALDGWREGEASLHERLAAALESAIQRNDLLPGARLPPERLFAVQLGVARSTVSSACRLLERRGFIERRQGRGTHVTGGGESAGTDMRTADLTTSLQRNVFFRRIGERSADTIELLGSAAPPNAVVRKMMAAAKDAVDTEALMADHGYFPLGYPPLRQAVAAHMTQRGLSTTAEEILITGGAQQAISLLAGLYVNPNAVVVLEDPTFPGAVDAFRTAGGRVLTVPVYETSASVELLAATMSQIPVSAVYVMPTFHNPTGSVMPDGARRELARFSRASRIPIIEDNTLAELALANDPPPPLAAYSRDAQIVSIASLSKVFWGGLRVGWIRAPRGTIARLAPRKAVADLGTPLISQAIAVNILAQADNLREFRRRELAERLAFAEDRLRRELPAWAWRRPAGGLSIWARLPEGSSNELAQVAGRHGVLIAPGSVMSPTGGFDQFIRLPFDHEAGVLDEGIRRLASAWKAYRTELDSRASGSSRLIV